MAPKRSTSVPVIRTPERLLSWASSHPLLKVTRTDVPSAILPSSIASATLCDVKVHPKRRGQPDDEIYLQHAEIRRYVPRGLCLLEYVDRRTSSSSTAVLVSAMHKFSGGMGDEDDTDVTDEQEWRHFFIAPLEDTATIVQTSKENGEAAHYSVFRFPHDDTVYQVAGSKHVHLLVRRLDDIELYVEPRFLVARRVATAVVRALSQLPTEGRQAFYDHLLADSLTTSFEILQPDYQHIELFDFTEPKLKFISFTKNSEAVVSSQDDDSATEEMIATLCQDPRLGAAIAQTAGFETITLAEWPLDEMENLFTHIRQGYGKEGSVLYFVDANRNVIGLLKKKTMWYILLRAIREKSKGLAHQYRKEIPTESKISYTAKKTESRLKAIQQWLSFNDEHLAAWQTLALAFFEWLEPQLRSQTVTPDEVASMFPPLWNRFLTETSASDNIFQGQML